MRDAILHSYPMYPADWLRSETRMRLTSAGRGMIRELFDYCWIEGSLPNDQQALLSISGGTPKEFFAEWPKISPCFTIGEDGRLHHWKVDEKRPMLVGVLEKRKKAGEASGNSRRNQSANTCSTSVPTHVQQVLNERSNETPTHAEPSSSSSVSVSSSISKYPPMHSPVADAVQEFRELHPKGSNENMVCLFFTNHWQRLAEDEQRWNEWLKPIRKSLKAYREYWDNNGQAFAPKLEAWLNDEWFKKKPPTTAKRDLTPEVEYERL